MIPSLNRLLFSVQFGKPSFHKNVHNWVHPQNENDDKIVFVGTFTL